MISFVCCLLSVVCWLFAVRCFFFVVRCLSFVGCCLLYVVCCVSFVLVVDCCCVLLLRFDVNTLLFHDMAGWCLNGVSSR